MTRQFPVFRLEWKFCSGRINVVDWGEYKYSLSHMARLKFALDVFLPSRCHLAAATAAGPALQTPGTTIGHFWGEEDFGKRGFCSHGLSAGSPSSRPPGPSWLLVTSAPTLASAGLKTFEFSSSAKPSLFEGETDFSRVPCHARDASCYCL
jgi:hypothetical protein